MKTLSGFLDRQNKIILLVAGISAAAILVFFFRDIVQVLIINPFLYAFYWVRIIYKTLPQIWWWSILLVILFFISLRSLTRRKTSSSNETEQSNIRKSPLEKWDERFNKAERGGYFKWFLAHEISLLALNLIADQERIPTEEANQYFTEGKFNLPPDIYEYMKTGLDARISFQFTNMEKRLYFFGSRSVLNIKPEEMIEFLEDRLE